MAAERALIRKPRRVAVFVLAALAALGATPHAAPASRRLLVVSPSADDPRLALVRDAIAFWRDVFAKLGLEPPFFEAGVGVAIADARALENYAWQISRSAGRLPDGIAGPPPPPELLALEGDIIVLLSAQRLMPFARPMTDSRRYFVAIARDPSESDRVARNIVAHELGHTLGLRHGDDPTSLMCEPCSTTANDAGADYRPLTDADRARLVELYGPGPP
jgi:hypothetical protein